MVDKNKIQALKNALIILREAGIGTFGKCPVELLPFKSLSGSTSFLNRVLSNSAQRKVNSCVLCEIPNRERDL